ncbi:Coatomer subunit epsilon [Sarcoptes scabiei]|uniref:Coatomer subunit epsilon n=1 Tax=Sarcoptes scabiei TaxID=52283 RepID=A0A834RFZ3_SARSC|nr:Coatomer subunit epsilon [Sarcoptes scabiei]
MTNQQNNNLFDLKNSFYLGNWQQCLNEAQSIKPINDEQRLERDFFMYRAYIAQKKYHVVISEVKDSSPQPLKAVRLLAEYLSRPDDRDSIIEKIDADKTLYMSDNYSSVCAASIYSRERSYENAMKILNNSDDIECMAASVQTMLALDRVDLARKEYKKMAAKDEYHTLSQLCLAWIIIYENNEKLQDAYFIYQELKEKFGPTPLLLNGQATVLICQNRLDEAETLINEAISKDPNYTEAIVNQVILSSLKGKSSEVINRIINQLNDLSLDQTFIKDYEAKQRDFDRISATYQIA